MGAQLPHPVPSCLPFSGSRVPALLQAAVGHASLLGTLCIHLCILACLCSVSAPAGDVLTCLCPGMGRVPWHSLQPLYNMPTHQLLCGMAWLIQRRMKNCAAQGAQSRHAATTAPLPPTAERWRGRASLATGLRCRAELPPPGELRRAGVAETTLPPPAYLLQYPVCCLHTFCSAADCYSWPRISAFLAFYMPLRTGRRLELVVPCHATSCCLFLLLPSKPTPQTLF